MPELPEVETVARRLASAARGRRILDVEIRDPKLDAQGLRTLQNHRIHDVSRLGKQCLLHLKPPRARTVKRWLAVHLRMTGQLYWLASPPTELRHLRARLGLDRGHLVFVDLRRFGTMRVLEDLQDAAPSGLDPTQDAFTPGALAALLQSSRQPLKPWLLRQDRIVGLGNIYASEILFRARLSPQRPAGSLDRPEVRRLHRATREVLERAIRAAGTTFYAIEAGRRLSGTFKEQLRVYGREEEPCLRCGTPVRRTVQAQRSTYHCPQCQAD